MPNAESALNEEAGKLLLERYDDYSERAKMMTEIHAQVKCYCNNYKLLYCIFCRFTLKTCNSNHSNTSRAVEKAVKQVWKAALPLKSEGPCQKSTQVIKN